MPKEKCSICEKTVSFSKADTFENVHGKFCRKMKFKAKPIVEIETKAIDESNEESDAETSHGSFATRHGRTKTV